MRRRAAEYRRPVRRRFSYWIWALFGLFSIAGLVLLVVHHNQHEDRVEQPVLSFGGFCCSNLFEFCTTRTKTSPFNGGIPPIGNGCAADAVYKACFEQIIHQNEKYYQRCRLDGAGTDRTMQE